jgi:hypothetical protein
MIIGILLIFLGMDMHKRAKTIETYGYKLPMIILFEESNLKEFLFL